MLPTLLSSSILSWLVTSVACAPLNSTDSSITALNANASLGVGPSVNLPILQISNFILGGQYRPSDALSPGLQTPSWKYIQEVALSVRERSVFPQKQSVYEIYHDMEFPPISTTVLFVEEKPTALYSYGPSLELVSDIAIKNRWKEIKNNPIRLLVVRDKQPMLEVKLASTPTEAAIIQNVDFPGLNPPGLKWVLLKYRDRPINLQGGLHALEEVRNRYDSKKSSPAAQINLPYMRTYSLWPYYFKLKFEKPDPSLNIPDPSLTENDVALMLGYFNGFFAGTQQMSGFISFLTYQHPTAGEVILGKVQFYNRFFTQTGPRLADGFEGCLGNSTCDNHVSSDGGGIALPGALNETTFFPRVFNTTPETIVNAS